MKIRCEWKPRVVSAVLRKESEHQVWGVMSKPKIYILIMTFSKNNIFKDMNNFAIMIFGTVYRYFNFAYQELQSIIRC